MNIKEILMFEYQLSFQVNCYAIYVIDASSRNGTMPQVNILPFV